MGGQVVIGPGQMTIVPLWKQIGEACGRVSVNQRRLERRSDCLDWCSASSRAAVIAAIAIFAVGCLPVDSVFEDVLAQPPRRH
jgi:hypothetical protein